jgi:hypothetical protein
MGGVSILGERYVYLPVLGVGWLVALVAYRHYPRLLLPALPALALAAGLGAERLLSLLFGGARRGVLAFQLTGQGFAGLNIQGGKR